MSSTGRQWGVSHPSLGWWIVISLSRVHLSGSRLAEGRGPLINKVRAEGVILMVINMAPRLRGTDPTRPDFAPTPLGARVSCNITCITRASCRVELQISKIMADIYLIISPSLRSVFKCNTYQPPYPPCVIIRYLLYLTMYPHHLQLRYNPYYSAFHLYLPIFAITRMLT